MKQVKYLFALTTIGALATASVQADSISPATYADTLAVGESVTIKKTVTITKEAPTTAKVDVFFLFDTTGSMGGLINAAKTQATTILNDASGLGDVEFGVGHYEDFPTLPFGSSTDTPYTLLQDIGSSAAAHTAIAGLSLGSGWDIPESNLHALKEVADTTTWRTDSTRIVVQFGDAVGHDGSEVGYPGPTLSETTTALGGNNVTVQIVDVGGTGMDVGGQATTITSATGGTYFPGTDPSSIVDAISGALAATFAEYSEVTLDLTGVPAGVDVTASPVSYVGDYDRSEDRTFEFDVTFEGVTPGDYSFGVRALADGGLLATELDRIRVTAGGPTVPDGGASAVMLGIGLLSLGFVRRQMKS